MADKILVVIAGPTAVGKSALAVTLALRWKTEIISADARQVFRELEKGTAKPGSAELNLVRHHLINIRSIHDRFSAGQYATEARLSLDQVFESHDIALLCGGSGLYINALLEGFDDLPDVPAEIREVLVSDYKEKGLAWLQEMVSVSDPEYYSVVDRNNPQRLMRALEVIRHSGKPISSFRVKRKNPLPYQIVKVGLDLDRDELYRRIDERMDAMIADGLFEEAASFKSYSHLNALQTVGYQEIFGYLDGRYDKEEAIRLLKRNSRHYAKRQLTWFRRDPAFRWFHPDQTNEIIQYVEGFWK